MKKISYSEYKEIQRKIAKMSQKQLSIWLTDMFNEVYQSGYEDGFQSCMHTPLEETEDWEISIAIQSTEGVGPVLHKKIMDNIYNLCFGGNKG